MKDVDPQKTRIQPSGKKVRRPDATRVAPASDATSSVEKTRIAGSPVNQLPRSDATRISPQRKGSADKTLVPPTVATGRLSGTQNAETHILKERFILEEVLGAGGMGVVYKARDLLKVEAQDRDPYVAIKVLSEEFKTHPEAFISLQRESRKSQRVAHPNIVNVYDFDRDGDTVFMTMEYLDGEPLDELIAQYSSTGLPTDDAWNIIRGMTSALIHAHAGKIIHSDFKPGNVFVTGNGLAKVFDFGIARAVAQVEHLEDNPNDQTLFDAGNLGALTPAYASLEMLESEEPDVRDDIYALGCVAYEMLTGGHPYNKVPADEAERQCLKPKRIGHIKKRQWKAIERAIAFRREDRLASVKEFEDLIKPKRKSSNWLVTSLAILFAAGVTTYFLVFKEEPKVPEFSEFDIRNELELKIRIDFLKEDVALLLGDTSFSDRWQDSLWKDISDLTILTKGKDAWLEEQKHKIFGLYIVQIEDRIRNKQYIQAQNLIDSARQYSPKNIRLDELNALVATGKKHEEARIKLEASRASEDQKKKKALAQSRKLKLQQQENQKQQLLVQQKASKEQFTAALENLNNQLRCQASLNMRNIETAVVKLKQVDSVRFQSIESKVIKSLANCIVQIGTSFPERARAAKTHSMKLFESSVLRNIKIKSRDPCDASLAGLGSRGKRATCRDKLKKSNYGPELVVIPGNSKLKMFALGKYELTVGEFKQYCLTTTSCSVSSQNDQKPVSDITLSSARAYLKWLSQQTGKRYRLPSKIEWTYAMRSRSKTLDPNRNCALSTRGFEKGSNLVKYSIGKQNPWGLVNFVGNVQEWVYGSGNSLQAVGGSFREPMESCTIATGKKHNGKADSYTGFRVLREMEE
ncbi:MAG: protein kinase [Gammaproteobacteria bacterium]|nr:protein kinase [Gammaproteobacteria bacterium]